MKAINSKGKMNFEEMKSLSDEEQAILFKKISRVRKLAKVANFSCTYGAGPKKISDSADIPLSDGYSLHKSYWTMNKALKDFTKSLKVRVSDKRKWVFCPVSGFWLSLKDDKDKFSVVNQHTGAFVFDMWSRFAKEELQKMGYDISFQCHDELLLYYNPEDEDTIRKILEDSMKKVNKILNLNVEIGISVMFGNNYYETH